MNKFINQEDFQDFLVLTYNFNQNNA